MKLKEIAPDLLIVRKEPFLPLDSTGAPLKGKIVEKNGELVVRKEGKTIMYYVYVVYDKDPEKIHEVPISAIALRG